MIRPTITVETDDTGRRVLTFAQPAVVLGSGETRRVIREAVRTRVEFEAAQWSEFVDVIMTANGVPA